jgi:GTP-binding protein Era
VSPTHKFVSGFVSILGRPNAGKSTLLNALVGTKVAIVADKPQTTRTTIQGVLTEAGAQIVFLDTPGIHKADTPLNKRMMETVRAALDERDLLLFVADATRRFEPEDARALDLVRKAETPALLALNKIDLVKDKRELLPLIEAYNKEFEFAESLPVSARRGDGIGELRRAVIARLPEGPAYFPPDFVTDQPERFLVAELVREKALLLTREEVPHSVAVLVDKWEETPQITRVYATMYVEREGQKKIVIGAKAAMLKRIGTMAREEMEKLLGRRFYLDLHVKVQPNWRERAAFLNALDWRRQYDAIIDGDDA